MKISIRIIYQANGNKIMQKADFPVNYRKSKENPDQTAARVASYWLNQIKHEMNIADILKVVYNEDIDITELVKQLEESPIPDMDLPF